MKARINRVSIPFFYEPNFDAVVEPLHDSPFVKPRIGKSSGTDQSPVVYGAHLLSKVGGNFEWNYDIRQVE